MTGKKLSVLHLTTHLNLGGISSYLVILNAALSRRGHRVAVLSSGGQKTEDLENAGVSCFNFPIRTKSELHPKLFLSLAPIVSLLRKEPFDLLHAHTRVTQVLAGWISRCTGLPYISTAHGFYKPHWGRRIFPCWGEHVIAVSDVVAKDLEKTHGIASVSIAVVNNALDIEDIKKRFESQDSKKNRLEYGIPDDAFVIGCVARLVRDKGQEYLIEAARKLIPENLNVFLLIVGDGREKKNLEELVKKHALKDRVCFIPGVNDTTKVLSVIDLFAHPATFREGFGLSMAEAMVVKIPVVATAIPAIDTIFQNDRNAVLVPPKNAEALANAILALAKDTVRAKMIAGNGYILASQLCQSDRQAEEMEKVYYDVIARRR